MSLTEIVLAVLALAAIGVAIYLHTANGAAKLAALEAKIKATEATVTAYFAGFHAAAVPSTQIVADPSPAAPVAPPVAPPATPVTVPVVTISGSPGDITSLLFPKPTAPSVVPPAAPAGGTGDAGALMRARMVLDGFGQNAIVKGKTGSIAVRAPSYPAFADSTAEVAQTDPSVKSPESVGLWYGAAANAPKPDGTQDFLNGNDRLTVPADGFVCYESDTGGEFTITLHTAVPG